MKIDWKSLYSKIPTKFKMGSKTFKVNWVDKFDDGPHVGLSDHNNKAIYIKNGQTKKEAVHTYIHEILHITSDEFDIKLSEKQVQGLEKTLIYWITNGNIFKDE